MSKRIHFRIAVYGRVQGVFYRVSTKIKADELGVSGFVRNERDGSVYIEAEGEEEIVHKFIAWCNQGPAGASVEQVRVEEDVVKNLSGFLIDR